MPLASSNTARGKSRSPAPPQSSRPFLPPSHYAAAAGYSGSKAVKTPSSLDELDNAETPTYKVADYSQYDNFMPMSQHSPERSSPDSSSEYKLPKDTRFSFIAEARIISSRTSQREKRQSTLTGLPNIETQLLPSLRDTIDRMTRPPSRPPTSQSNHLDAPVHSGRPPDSVNMYDPRQMRSHHTPGADWTPDAPEIALSHSNDTTPLVASTPKLKTPSHSALKSSLRAPTPKIMSPDNSTTTPVQSASGSLRSVKSFLGRKISFTTPPASPSVTRSQTPRKSSLKVSSTPNTPTSRNKQQFDTAVSIPPPPPAKSYEPTIPPIPPDKTGSKSPAKTRPYQSNIPRPKSRFNPPSLQSKASTDDSDLENRYERYSRDKRKLTVANAEVLASGSSSESDLESGGRSWDTGVARQSPNNRGAVGLGLDMSVEMGRNGRWEELEIQDHTRQRYSRDNRDSARQKVLRFSLPPSESAGSRYSENNDAAFRQPHTDQVDLDADHERRRAALMSIVSGLDADMNSATPKVSESQGSGEYFGEQGFAYSGSRDMSFAAAFPRRKSLVGKENEHQDKDEGEWDREDVERPRSSSCTPMLWVSPEEAMGDIPPRSRSACHWNTNSSSRSSYRESREPGPVDDGKRQSSLSSFMREGREAGLVDDGRRKSSLSSMRGAREAGPVDDGKRKSSLSSMHGGREAGPANDSKRQSSLSSLRQSIPPIPRRPSTVEDTRRWGVHDDERLRKLQLSSPLTNTDQSFHSSAGHSSYSVAARERLAFGIPPSESDEVHLIPEILSQTDSSLSLLEGGHWQEEWDGLSSGAESLFRQLSFESTAGYQRRSRQVLLEQVNRTSLTSSGSYRSSSDEGLPNDDASWRATQAFYGHQEPQASPRQQEPQASPRHQEPQASPRHQELQAFPLHQEPQASPRHQELQAFPLHQEPQASPRHQRPQESPRHQESPRQAPSSELLQVPWDDSTLPETARERVIRELRKTEEVFVDRLQTCVRVFILPLRVQNSREWIAGIPANVSRLLDWFEDIMNLHLLILQALAANRTWDLTESLRAFIPRLEIYQPYLVRLADVTEEIVVSMADESSNFGEFVNIQEGTPECEGWSFEGLLMEPVHRLAAYQDLFTRLLESTPTSHPGYISTFFLARSTDVVINVMKEVKVREDEYNLIKSLSTRIQGVPLDHLATRERRLLHSGILHLNTLDEHLQRAAAAETEPSSKSTNRTSRLANAIHEWNPQRSNSVKSTASSSTGTSAFSDLQIWPPGPFRLSIPKMPLLLGRRNVPQETPTTASPRAIPVQVFVFSDLVLLTIPLAQLPGQEPGYSLVSEIGALKPFSIARTLKDDANDVLTVEGVPVEPNELNQEGLPANASLQSLEFSVPQASPMVSPAGIDVDPIQPWLSAFTRCSRLYLRSLRFPSRNDTQDYAYDSDEASDLRYTVSCLLSSGLPMPKSPSGQLSTNRESSTETDSKTMEREERGWWSLRYQQILGEFRRRDLCVSESVSL